LSRIETIGNATLYLGDCREILPTLAGVDAIVSDPPYGIAHQHSGKGNASRGNLRGGHKGRIRNTDAIAGDAEPFDPTFLLGFDNVLLFGADHFRARLPEHGRFLAWNKIGTVESWDTFSDVEFAWHSKGKAARIFTYEWKGLMCRKVGEDNGRRDHPTQKPIQLMKWCITQAALEPNSLICDPFMGTGTTGVAAVTMGHRFAGIEIEEKYFDLACRRAEEAQRQQQLAV